MADRIFSIAALMFAGLFLYESRLFAEKNATQTFSSAFFPRIIIFMMILFSLLLLIRSFMNRGQPVSLQKSILFFKTHWRVPVLLGLFILYLAVMPDVGFFSGTVLFLLISFVMLQPLFSAKRVLLFVPLSLALTFIIQFVFEKQLHILLP